jgi:hypothetical protein
MSQLSSSQSVFPQYQATLLQSSILRHRERANMTNIKRDTALRA